MLYDPVIKAFECTLCGPGRLKWKNVFSQVLVDEETGDCYCVVHQENKIGEYNMVPEWVQEGEDSK